MTTPEFSTLSSNVVAEMAKSVSVPWERIVVNYEIIDLPGSRAQNEFTFIMQRDAAGKYSVANFVMSDEAKAALLELRESNLSDSGDKWSTCILILDPSGRFKLDFSYGEPKVLNGVLGDEYKFYRKYLPHYLDEKGLTQ